MLRCQRWKPVWFRDEKIQRSNDENKKKSRQYKPAQGDSTRPTAIGHLNSLLMSGCERKSDAKRKLGRAQPKHMAQPTNTNKKHGR